MTALAGALLLVGAAAALWYTGVLPFLDAPGESEKKRSEDDTPKGIAAIEGSWACPCSGESWDDIVRWSFAGDGASVDFSDGEWKLLEYEWTEIAENQWHVTFLQPGDLHCTPSCRTINPYYTFQLEGTSTFVICMGHLDAGCEWGDNGYRSYWRA